MDLVYSLPKGHIKIKKEMIKKMTNETDLRECFAQIELIRQLIAQPETFDLDKVLIELEIKKELLMAWKPRSYAVILEGLESGILTYPTIGDIKRKLREAKQFKSLDEKKRVEAEALRLIEVREAKEELEENSLSSILEEPTEKLTEKEERIAELKAELVTLEPEEVEE